MAINHIKIYIHWESRRILERPEATKGFDLVHLEQMHSAFQFKEHVHNQRHHYRLVQQRISAVKWLELYITDLKAKEILCIAALWELHKFLNARKFRLGPEITKL